MPNVLQGLIASLVLLLLVACAAPLNKHEQGSAPARTPSSDLFWRHIAEAGSNDWFHLLNDGEEALRWRLAMIDSAHHTIDMETFLWKGDKGGTRILSHLLAAADRGVQVRILIDDSFTPHQDLMLYALDSHPNIELRIYNPYSHRAGGMATRFLFNLGDFQRVNHRLHNKSLVVDGWVANVGGRNLADEYFGLHDEHNFRDMEVLTMGDSVATVAEHFASFWNSGWTFPAAQVLEVPEDPGGLATLRSDIIARAGEPALATEAELEAMWEETARRSVSGSAVFVADKPALNDPAQADDAPGELAEYILGHIARARQEIIIVSAYLVPTEELALAVRDALARGVRVRILTNSMRSNNHLAAHAAYSAYVRGLVEEGVELFELRTDATDRNLYMRDPVEDKKLGLHAKFMLIDDDRVFIGSSNMDPRSLKLNTEVCLMVESRELNRLLRDSIALDFAPRNAWSVRLDGKGDLVWMGGSDVLHHPPADSVFQRLEDWFIGLLPIHGQM